MVCIFARQALIKLYLRKSIIFRTAVIPTTWRHLGGMATSLFRPLTRVAALATKSVAAPQRYVSSSLPMSSVWDGVFVDAIKRSNPSGMAAGKNKEGPHLRIF